ncbi:MAG: rod shape-determining protein RodA [Clostridium sp.]|jgi:rod shape determining protein RodA|uniref:rod shape-determining protein RodA n=1 Tax=Clostridium sp. TaxID=1506 RepID=UPI0025BDE7C5|nr:rod shape-determining protein RodA [Clostridium sp.]MCH3964729.1 rod shape-determining protein RodA [Clostridium sp.]MCI1715200.1 rod shape-determining protein RodA [Clostridium sp.]MCI1799462.1 rod shape-determining protein RodA [Clostridium sp.]MCI1813383.1 rod shape-determining protein RodA [Clostridium sp.]MCI1870274.1 rod shape-determining protein RodA [Clostridium sp.]
MLEKFAIDRRFLRELDFTIIITIIVISIFGSLNIYSATRMTHGFSTFKSQIIWIIGGIILTYIVLVIDYTKIKNYASIIYWFGVFLLVLNCIPGLKSTVNGAASWISLGFISFQPSEIAKTGIIVMLAKKLDDMKGNINNLRNFCELTLYAVIPMALIIQQPDMGMTMVCFFTVLGIYFGAGLNSKTIAGGIVAVAAAVTMAWKFSLIEEYQKKRIVSLFDPVKYEMSYSLQLRQSQIGIGSGGILGKGFLNGTQISGGYVPFASTDFIFSVVGEEWGFLGASLLILFYGIVLYRIISIAREAKDIFGSMVCIGVVSTMLFSILQNIGMTIGLLPITGITLPFMSYGGSSILTAFINIAMVLNIGMRRKKINF